MIQMKQQYKKAILPFKTNAIVLSLIQLDGKVEDSLTKCQTLTTQSLSHITLFIR